MRRLPDPVLVEEACFIGYAGWQGEGLQSVVEVVDFFDRLCDRIGHKLGDYCGAGRFLDWFDKTPRQEMRYEMIKEVDLALFDRELQEHVVTSLGIDVRVVE